MWRASSENTFAIGLRQRRRPNDYGRREDVMTKRSRYEREQRAAQNVRIREITAAWEKAIPPERAEAFAREVEAARARGPRPRQPDMAPGTRPNPPAPGNEPRPPKDSTSKRRRY